MNMPRINKKATGENIKRLARLNHMTVFDIQMALRIGSSTNIYMWMRGQTIPNPDYLVKLARLFDCTIDEILITEG